MTLKEEKILQDAYMEGLVEYQITKDINSFKKIINVIEVVNLDDDYQRGLLEKIIEIDDAELLIDFIKQKLENSNYKSLLQSKTTEIEFGNQTTQDSFELDIPDIEAIDGLEELELDFGENLTEDNVSLYPTFDEDFDNLQVEVIKISIPIKDNIFNYYLIEDLDTVVKIDPYATLINGLYILPTCKLLTKIRILNKLKEKNLISKASLTLGELSTTFIEGNIDKNVLNNYRFIYNNLIN